jgi:hypothetical protein
MQVILDAHAFVFAESKVAGVIVKGNLLKVVASKRAIFAVFKALHSDLQMLHSNTG